MRCRLSRLIRRSCAAVACAAALAQSIGCSRTAAVSTAAVENCSIAGVFRDDQRPDRIRFVATNGSDADGDGSAAKPFLTIARAVRDATPGTAIYVRAGTYAGGVFLSDIRGTAEAPIWISGAPGDASPVLRGGGDALHVVRPRYLIIQNFEIRDAAGNGINIDDGDDVGNPDAARFVILRRLAIHDVGLRPSGIADCLKLAGVSDVDVRDSTFGRCGTGPSSGAVGIGGVGVHRATVAFNRFVGNGYGAVQFKGGSDDIRIVGNVMKDTGWRGVNMGGSTGTAVFRPPLSASGPNYEAARIHTTANLFIGNETAAAFTGCVECEFTHNTVVDPTKWTVRILQETISAGPYTFSPASSGRISDNIFYFRRSDLNTGEDINVGAGTEPMTFVLTRNLWYSHDAPRLSAPQIGAVGAERGSIVSIDPQFVNVDADDVHLRRNSVAVGAGDERVMPLSDLDGKCYGRPPSLGALR